MPAWKGSVFFALGPLICFDQFSYGPNDGVVWNVGISQVGKVTELQLRSARNSDVLEECIEVLLHGLLHGRTIVAVVDNVEMEKCHRNSKLRVTKAFTSKKKGGLKIGKR